MLVRLYRLLVVLFIAGLGVLTLSSLIATGQLDEHWGSAVVDASEPSSASSAPTVPISITESGFDPAVVTVEVGTTVMWTNCLSEAAHMASGEPYRIYLPWLVRAVAHTAAVASALPGDISSLHQNGWADVDIAPGKSYTHTFYTTGSYFHHLSTAPYLTGRVVVRPVRVTNVRPEIVSVDGCIYVDFSQPIHPHYLAGGFDVWLNGSSLGGTPSMYDEDTIVWNYSGYLLPWGVHLDVEVDVPIQDLFRNSVEYYYEEDAVQVEADTYPPEPIQNLALELGPDLVSSHLDATLSGVYGGWTTSHDNETMITDTARLYAFQSFEDAQSLISGTLICEVHAAEDRNQSCYEPATSLTLGKDYFFRATVRDVAGNVRGSNIVSGYLETLAEYAVWRYIVPDPLHTLDSSGIYSDSLEGRAFVQYDTWRLAGLLAAPYTDPSAQQLIYDALLSYVDGQGIAELTIDPDRASVLILKPSPSGLNVVTMNLDLSDGRDANQIWFGYTDEEMDLIGGYLAEVMIPLIDANPDRYEPLLPSSFWW